MSYTLLIVESPAKCGKIESFLGKGYKVIGCYGHITHLSDLNQIDIDANYKPTFNIVESKKPQIAKINKAINGGERFTIASLIRIHASLKCLRAGALLPRPVLIVITRPVIKRSTGATNINVAFNFIPIAKAVVIVFSNAWKAPLKPLTIPRYEKVLITNREIIGIVSDIPAATLIFDTASKAFETATILSPLPPHKPN